MQVLRQVGRAAHDEPADGVALVQQRRHDPLGAVRGDGDRIEVRPRLDRRRRRRLADHELAVAVDDRQRHAEILRPRAQGVARGAVEELVERHRRVDVEGPLRGHDGR